IAHNRIVDGARRNSRRFKSEVPVDELPVNVADDRAAARSGDYYGDLQALRRAIEGLPKGQRTAVELLKLREMSLKEAAAASGMTIGALKVSTHRAIERLRASFDA